MRIETRRKHSGSTLLVMMILTGLMGIALASYLVLVRGQNLSVVRSLSWNSCVPIMEAGVEEALVHINRSGLPSLQSAGWEFINGQYTKKRVLGDSFFITHISTADPPVIVSEGHVPVPLTGVASVALMGAVGLEGLSGVQYTVRRVRVTTRKDAMWTHAMVAKGVIDMKGNNISTDSFDSSNPAYSTNRRYDITKRRDKGDVATNSTITNSLNVADADLWGKATTGPGGSVAIGPNGSVGDLAWHAAYKRGIQEGWSSNDMNVYLGDVKQPYPGGFTPQSETVGSTNFLYVLRSDDYVMENLTLTGSQVMYVAEGRCRLRVTGSIDISGTAMIQIAQGASLELYMEGASANIGGNGVANETGVAASFLYFGLPTNTAVSYSGNAGFVGAIYAPSADLSLSGGGRAIQDFCGSSVSNTVQMNGHFKFHYDEALGRSGWTRGYVANSWHEM